MLTPEKESKKKNYFSSLHDERCEAKVALYNLGIHYLVAWMCIHVSEMPPQHWQTQVCLTVKTVQVKNIFQLIQK